MSRDELLIITLSDVNRKLFTSALEGEFSLLYASSGEEALELLKKKLPAAVVMDHSIEDFLTYVFIDKIRNSPVSRNLPFVIVSRESTNSFVEQAVRSGVSHYVGIPFEPAALRQKIKSALNPGGPKDWSLYFRLPGELETTAKSFGRISYVSENGVHFETHLKLAPHQKLKISSPIFEDMNIGDVEVEVETVSSDVYYNYPSAIDAQWCDEKIRHRMKGWIVVHKNLNSPKKRKILLVQSSREQADGLTKNLDASQYSLRIVKDLTEALVALPYMKPACFVVSSDIWSQAGSVGSKILTLLPKLESRWMLTGNEIKLAPQIALKPFVAPQSSEAIVAGITHLVPPVIPDPTRIYFSKHLDYSRCSFNFQVKTLILGEMGVKLAFPFELSVPCNLQLGLKAFTEQNLRNPFVRVWPPLESLAPQKTGENPFLWAAETHFLGINDQQGQGIRLWLRNHEMEETRSELYKPPRHEGQEPPVAPKKQEPPPPKKK